MTTASLHPLDPIPLSPLLRSLPKAELHLHQEALPWLDRAVATREGRPPHNWRREVARMLSDVPPGMPRLDGMNGSLPTADLEPLDGDPEGFVDRVAAILELSAAQGAVLVEIRFGGATVLRPEMMALFREAERRVQARYPSLRAEAILCLMLPFGQPEQKRRLEACLRAAREGLSGIDVIPVPYDTEADWATIYPLIAPLAAAGLGVTVHAGEFSTANLAAALHVPGVTRIGHAVYAARDPHLLEMLAKSGATVECCPTSNVILGAVQSYEDLPIRRFMQAGIPITLNTDNPLRLCARIGREYAVTAALGLSHEELLEFTRNAVRASFATASRREELLRVVDAWAAAATPSPNPPLPSLRATA
jgi:adenosine deaminase